MDSPLYYFFLNHWWAILIIMLWELSHIFFTHFLGTVPFFFSNILPLFLNGHFLCCFLLSYWWSVLIILLCRLWHNFYSNCKWNYISFFCVNVIQVSCKISPLPLCGPSGELCRSPSWDYRKVFFQFLIHLWSIFYFYVEWIGHSTWLFLDRLRTSNTFSC